MIIKEKRILKIIKLSKQAFGKYKFQIIILTILGFLSGLLEGVGINAIIPLFSFATKNYTAPTDKISLWLEKLFNFFNLNFSLKYILILICLLFIIKAIILIFAHYLKFKIIAEYEEKTRTELFKKTLQTNWSYLIKQKISYLENVLIMDVKQSAAILEQISISIMIITSLLIYTLIAINISISITLISLVLGCIILLSIKPITYKAKLLSDKNSYVFKEVAHYVNENILGMKTVKSANVIEKVLEIGKTYFEQLKNIIIKISMLKVLPGCLIQPMSLIFVCLVFAFSYKTQAFNFGSLIAVIYLINKIFVYIQQLQVILHSVGESSPYLKNIADLYNIMENNIEQTGGTKQFIFNNELELKKIKFAYNGNNEILSEINFAIKRGEMVGLIGHSGAGKTTIVDLILRLFNPNYGQILLDGTDISQISIKEWRKNIGYVSQDIFLMNDTIANNIKFYNDLDQDEVEKFAKMANIYDFIESLPDKFETNIGERGIFLSVGQRQRIIIARILSRKPNIIILDEATSALDNESELKIQKTIENLKGKITVLVIAHRLSTILNSDKLLILDKGKIIEEGKPQELLKNQNSYFYKIYNIKNNKQ